MDGTTFIQAFGLMFVIEGLAYALFPDHMRSMIVHVLDMPKDHLRTAGLIFAGIGYLVMWAASA